MFIHSVYMRLYKRVTVINELNLHTVTNRAKVIDELTNRAYEYTRNYGKTHEKS